ncbi:hypothetical protein HYW55_05990 [Candidatus Gottesmanbacteria bacterium]|nr:hypothetical protein [Candidatus Gottesmanbacteria bacterium]
MSATPPQAQSEQEQEEYKGLTDWEIAQIEAMQSGFGEQNKISGLALLATSFGAATHGLEIHDAGKLLENIDPEKLLKDPLYRQRVIRGVQLHDRYGRILQRGKNKKEEVAKAKRALKTITIFDSEKDNIRKTSAPSYSEGMRSVYGFSDEQMKKVTESALKTAKEEGISLQEAMRTEARKQFLQKQVVDGIEKDPTTKNLPKKEKEKLVAERVKTLDEEKGSQFVAKTQNVRNVENAKMDMARLKVKETLKREYPSPKKGPPPPNQPQQPQGGQPTTTTHPAPTAHPPPVARPAPTKNPFIANLQKGWSDFIANIQSRISSFINPISSGISQSGLGGAFREAGQRVGSFLGLGKEGSMLSKLGRLGGKLGKLANLAGKAIPGLGEALLAKDILSFLSGGLSDQVLKFVIGGIVSGAVLLPFLLVIGGTSLFSSNTYSDPEIISSVQSSNWNTFESAFLLRTSPKEAEWTVFTQTYLSPNQQVTLR